MKQKRFVALLCVLSSVFMLSGCAMHVPVIIPDDKNVLSLSSSVVKDLSSLNISVDGIMLYGTDTKGYQVTYKGSLSGDTSDVLSGKMHPEKASATSMNYYYVYPYHRDAKGKLIAGTSRQATYALAQ